MDRCSQYQQHEYIDAGTHEKMWLGVLEAYSESEAAFVRGDEDTFKSALEHGDNLERQRDLATAHNHEVMATWKEEAAAAAAERGDKEEEIRCRGEAIVEREMAFEAQRVAKAREAARRRDARRIATRFAANQREASCRAIATGHRSTRTTRTTNANRSRSTRSRSTRSSTSSRRSTSASSSSSGDPSSPGDSPPPDGDGPVAQRFRVGHQTFLQAPLRWAASAGHGRWEER